MREGAGRPAATLCLRRRERGGVNSYKRKQRVATLASGADRTQPRLEAFFVIVLYIKFLRSIPII